MKSILSLILTAALITACNSVYMKPGTVKPGTSVYAMRGGYSMRRSIKESLENRGYKVLVGKALSLDGNATLDRETYTIPKEVRYIVKGDEREEKFRPFWCALNGFWWWNFNVSIADQKTGEELMTWRGRGCANSSLRKLDKILDMMEGTDDNNTGNNQGNS